MNNTKISIFRSFQATPETKTLGGWISGCMTDGHKFAAKVKEYRQTGADHIKKGLPLATVGAVCEGGRKRSDVITRTGWIALDVDGKDNTHLPDAEAVRDAMAQIKYVAFAGLSVSGKGVWALVKVADPQKQARYFEQLQIDFKNRGIILDSTKGKNPNDARFYSFDPDAYVADDFEFYDRLPPEKPKRKPRPTGDIKLNNTDRYGEVALNDEIDILSRTANGSRNNQLFKSTASLAQLVAGGVLGKSEVIDALFSTARSIGLPKYEIETTINSGFKAGMKEPRKPAKTNHSKPLRKKDNGSNGQCETKEFRNNSNQPNNFNQPTKEVESNEDPAPHGFNPYTGEVFDERGYPADWDSITLN